MSGTVEEIDGVLLAEARRLLGTSGDAETVNRALSAVVVEHRRREAVEAEIGRYQQGIYAVLRAAGADR